LIIKYPGKTENGKRIGELVTNADVMPTLIDWLGLDMPELKYPMQGESLVDVMVNNGSMGRDYIVSESWSQATVITRDYKLGIMQDPTSAKPDLDYRDFGDMFFDRAQDPMEIINGINNSDYQKQIAMLRQYFDEYVQNTSAVGRDEMIENLIAK
jgi:arylsulfatase A-like enzyme